MATLAQPVVGSEAFRPRSSEYLEDPYRHLQQLRSQGGDDLLSIVLQAAEVGRCSGRSR
jgi:hypothetical protein